MNANYDSDDPEERTNEGGNVGEQQEEDGTEPEDDRDDDDTAQGGDEDMEQVYSDEDEEEVSSDEEEEHSSEDFISDGNEGSSDDDNEEEEDSNGDLDVVDRILEFLEEGARSHKRIWISSDEEEEWDLMDMLGELTDRGMDSLLEALNEMSGTEAGWDRLVEHLSVNLSEASHDVKFARRVSKILDCLNLASLEEFDINCFEMDDYGSTLRLSKSLGVDHYVQWMASAPCITRPNRLSTIHLGGLGHDPKVWDAFVERFPSIRKVELCFLEQAGPYRNGTLHAAGLAASLGRLPLLRTLDVEVGATGLSSILSGLCRRVGLLRNLEEVSLFFHGITTDLDNDEYDMVLDEICRELAWCTSLKDVYVMFEQDASKRMKDTGFVFDRLRTSGSIENLQLRCVDIHTRSEKQQGHLGCEPGGTPSKSSITNRSLKSLDLNDCRIGRSYSSALANFTGIERISLRWNSPDTRRPWRSPRTWAMLFRAHPQLKSIVVGNVEYAPASIDEEAVLAALVASLDLAGAVQDWTVCTNSCNREGQSVPLPSLESLLRKCKGKLTLRHDGINDRTSDSLCAGLSATPFLTNLQLTVTGEAMTNQKVVSILGALQENRFVTTFHGKFLCYSTSEVGILDPVLVDLLSTNTVLETFGIDLLVRRRFVLAIEGDAPPDYAELVVAPIANALAPNRKLKALYLNCLERIDPVSFAALSGMLKTNVTLEQIKFHDSVEDSEAKDTIEWVLTLNRYKRRCLFQNADPVQSSLDDKASLGADHHNPLEVPRPASDPDSLLAGVWPAVLGRTATDRRADVMYHFLRRMPKSLWVASSLRPHPPPPRQSGRGLKRACP
jgi:hypothetical protein